MKISTLKDLEKIVKFCRKQAITDIKIDGIELHIGSLPMKAKSVRQSVQSQTPTIAQYMPIITEQDKIVQEVSAIESDELTEDQKMFWSSEVEQ